MVLTVVFSEQSVFAKDRFNTRAAKLATAGDHLSSDEELKLLRTCSEVSLYVGQKAPWDYEDVKDVVEVQASGHELIRIQTMYPNLPTQMRKSDYEHGGKMVPVVVQRWFDTDAKYAASCWEIY